MKLSKKLLSVLLAVLLLASCMVTAFAASGTEGNITWNYDEATKTMTISGTGDMPDYFWNDPAWYIYNWNTNTVNYLFEIEHLIIENGVTSIGDNTFDHCESLKSVTIPDSVTRIGEGAFRSCVSLTSVTIPDSVTSIGWAAFRFCSALTEVNYTGSEAEWNNIAFGDPALPEGVTVNYNYGAAPQTVTVTVITDEGGTVTGGGTYTAGETVTVTATPNPGYRFDFWYESGARLSSDPSYTFEACDTELRATFTKVEDTDPGNTDPTPGNVCPWCGGVHEGLIQGIIGFFHRIFAAILGARY